MRSSRLRRPGASPRFARCEGHLTADEIEELAQLLVKLPGVADADDASLADWPLFEADPTPTRP